MIIKAAKVAVYVNLTRKDAFSVYPWQPFLLKVIVVVVVVVFVVVVVITINVSNIVIVVITPLV